MRGLSVVIPSKTPSNLIPCVRAIRCGGETMRVIVVDDFDTAVDRGKCFDEFFYKPNPGPMNLILGVKPFIFARNVNDGIRVAEASGGDDVIVLNDDALLRTPVGFSAMQAEADLHPEFGLISATTNVVGNPAQLPMGIGLRDSAGKSVAFVCVLIPRRTIEAVGLLDERFTAYGWEDNDYCRRVREAGLKIGIFDGCFVDHGSLKSTFRGEPGAAGNIYPGMEIYRQKWGDLE